MQRRSARGRVVALSSRDPRKLAGDWTGIRGNFGPRGTWMDLSGHALYPAAGDLQLFKLSGPPGQPTAVCGLGVYRD